MADTRDERLSQLIAQIHDAPSPEEAFSKWMLIDIAILDGLMMGFIFMLLIVRDLVVMSLVGAFSVAFAAVYLMWKREAKTKASLGKSFLDSQTIIGDMEMAEQIGIEGYEYIVLPEETIDGKEICYKKMDLDEVSQALASPFIRFGGTSALRPTVIDQLVQKRLMELKEEAERRAMERIEKKREKEDIRDVAVDVKESRGRLGRFRRKRIKKIGDATEDVDEISTGGLFSPIDREDDK